MPEKALHFQAGGPEDFTGESIRYGLLYFKGAPTIPDSKRSPTCPPAIALREKASASQGPPGDLFVTRDRVRLIWSFETFDLLLCQLDLEGRDCVGQMARLGRADDRSGDDGLG